MAEKKQSSDRTRSSVSSTASTSSGFQPARRTWWVFELKKGRPADRVVGQVSRYCGWLQAERDDRREREDEDRQRLDGHGASEYRAFAAVVKRERRPQREHPQQQP